ncbi:MAG: hypothetical protein NC429_06080 [Lachnospiraceae bacterium]|nr:hypothetical protein [Lachnospiraceae bacterium]
MRKTFGKHKRIIILVLAVFILMACGQQDEEKQTIRIQSQADVRLPDYPGAGSYDRTLTQGINYFAYEMSTHLAESGENYFFSPYSICVSLSILDNAAQGETKSQMEQMLGISDLMDWNMQMEFFREMGQSKEAMLTSADSIWVDQKLELSEELRENYLPLVENYYNAAVYQADFTNASPEVKKQMDQWVSENTNGMIKSCGEEPDANTALALINAVYFYGEWKSPFDAAVNKWMFYGTEGENEVDVMYLYDCWLHYYVSDGLRAVSLPYGNGSRVMNILIPADDGENQPKDSNQTAADIFGAMSAEEKTSFLDNLLTGNGKLIQVVRLPKFSMEYCVPQMGSLLREMGMENAFHDRLADFPGIGEVSVTDIMHKAKIEVDELGSRAAAVTEDSSAAASEDEEEREIIRFIVDHPFLFMIQDTETGIILFMGQVNNL